ncbi:MAG: CRISPR-associated endonuclease Cas2 [Clostridia bacterium]|nr:CRISPR-associated endonuclease Cas2 [Clostridia bacterium]
MLVIVAYDIVMDEKGSKILTEVHKICKRYLYKLQKSIFIGELSKPIIEELATNLKMILRKKDKCDILCVKNVKNIVRKSLTQNDEYSKINII